ncbi:MAG: four helix bundle protein [Alphaproteobacteria bacterium CG11_big_fil_rev_8_21_14_0_20_39_49]|nr:MAG: four helix bundle protein [Alphaproteobacteria bacterium CG11_big_fil_rev_8_21_14_0_20_39_49]
MKTKEKIVKSYKDLKIWQKSIDLVDFVYKETEAFPSDETYGLRSQIRRCAVSIPSNIAEGSSKKSTKELLRFLNIAYGSLSELETQFYIANRQNYIHKNILDVLDIRTSEIGKMVNGLRNNLYNKLSSSN